MQTDLPMQQVAPGVWRLPLPMRFHPGHINSYLLEDGDDWCVVDAGNHNHDTEALWTRVLDKGLPGGRVSRIVLTHAHPDHYGCAPWLLAQTGAQLLLAREEWQAVNTLWRGAVERPDDLARFFLERGVDANALPFIQGFMGRFRDDCPAWPGQPDFIRPDDTLIIGGQTWRLHGGYGHTPCNLLLQRESDGVVITGDQVLPAITPNISLWFDSDPDPLGLMLESLARLSALQVKLALPAHGEPFTDFSSRCRILERTYRRRLERVRTALANGPASLADLGRAGFGGAPAGPLYMLIAGQLLALLAHLQAAGEVIQDGDCYRLATH